MCCKNLIAYMRRVCFVVHRPAIHKFNQTLTSSSAVEAEGRLHFQDNNFTEASFTPPPPFPFPFHRKTNHSRPQSDSGRESGEGGGRIFEKQKFRPR